MNKLPESQQYTTIKVRKRFNEWLTRLQEWEHEHGTDLSKEDLLIKIILSSDWIPDHYKLIIAPKKMVITSMSVRSAKKTFEEMAKELKK